MLVANNNMGPIVLVQGKMAAEDYRAILRTHLLPIGAETILAIGFSNKTTIQLFGGVSIFFAATVYRNFLAAERIELTRDFYW